MPAVALSGRSPNTAPWMLSVLRLVGLPDDRLVQYRHWSNHQEASLEHEASLLCGLAPALVIAKSFGTNVAALAHENGAFAPNAAVLIGTPFSPMNEQELTRLRSFAGRQPTLFIQQEFDPGGGAALLSEVVRANTATIAAVAGNDHLYNNVEELARTILGWPAFHAQRGEA